MEYVYAGMWLLVGLILIFRLGKENKIFYLAGAFFLILGGWWGANIFTQEDLFSGVWGTVLRIITAIALVLLCLVFWKYYKTDRERFQKEQEAAKAGSMTNPAPSAEERSRTPEEDDAGHEGDSEGW